jgi:hypothetical protein
MPMQRAEPDVARAAASPAVPFHWTRPSGPDIEYSYAGVGGGQNAHISITMPYSVIYANAAVQVRGWMDAWLGLAPERADRSRTSIYRPPPTRGRQLAPAVGR